MYAAVNIGVEEMTATIVRFLLLVGAVFQLVCLGACIFIPESPSDSQWCLRDTDDESSENNTPQNTPKRPHYRSRKPEKKKRR